MKYIIYIRDTPKLTSEMQRKICRDWINKQENSGEIELFTEKNNEDVEPTDLFVKERPVLFQAITQLEKNDILVIGKRDVISDDFLSLALVYRLVIRKKALIHPVTPPRDSEQPFLDRFVNAYAAYESQLYSGRASQAIKRKRARNERVGMIPYGKQVDLNNKLINNPLEMAILNKIKTLRDQGKSFQDIAHQLNTEGLTRRTGGKWPKQGVHQLYKNYFGS